MGINSAFKGLIKSYPF